MHKQIWKKAIIGMSLVAVMGAPALGMAADFGPGFKHGGKGHHMLQQRFEKIAAELELTEGQKSQIRSDREANRAERHELAQQERTLRKKIRTALKEDADQSTLDGLAAELGALEVNKLQRRHENRERFLAVLTEEQKAELAELKQASMEKRKQRLEERQERREGREARSLNS